MLILTAFSLLLSRCRAPIASLDCMDDFSANSQQMLDQGKRDNFPKKAVAVIPLPHLVSSYSYMKIITNPFIRLVGKLHLQGRCTTCPTSKQIYRTVFVKSHFDKITYHT